MPQRPHIGYREPVQRVERIARIPAPPSDVFAYLADLDNIPQWQAGITSVRRTSPGPMQAGATAEVVRDLMGKPIVAPLLVSGYQPPHRLQIRTEVRGVRALAMLDLAPVDGGQTDVRFAMEIRASGLSSFMEPMIARGASAEVDSSLQRIHARFAAGAG